MSPSEIEQIETETYSLTSDILKTCDGKVGHLALCSCLNAAMTILQNCPESTREGIFKATSATLKDMAEVLDKAFSSPPPQSLH